MRRFLRLVSAEAGGVRRLISCRVQEPVRAFEHARAFVFLMTCSFRATSEQIDALAAAVSVSLRSLLREALLASPVAVPMSDGTGRGLGMKDFYFIAEQ